MRSILDVVSCPYRASTTVVALLWSMGLDVFVGYPPGPFQSLGNVLGAPPQVAGPTWEAAEITSGVVSVPPGVWRGEPRPGRASDPQASCRRPNHLPSVGCPGLEVKEHRNSETPMNGIPSLGIDQKKREGMELNESTIIMVSSHTKLKLGPQREKKILCVQSRMGILRRQARRSQEPLSVARRATRKRAAQAYIRDLPHIYPLRCPRPQPAWWFLSPHGSARVGMTSMPSCSHDKNPWPGLPRRFPEIPAAHEGLQNEGTLTTEHRARIFSVLLPK